MKYICPEEVRTKLGNLRYLDSLRLLARKNRREPTESERLFWDKVIKNDKTGYRFLRQKSIGRFVIDFYCSKLLLAIEIDGGYHLNIINRDIGRDEELIKRGIKTIRYIEKEIFNEIDWVNCDLKKRTSEREEKLR